MPAMGLFQQFSHQQHARVKAAAVKAHWCFSA
jgi:hypothetical protein